ncbi:MAG: GNAT family N-acetyltransferase [Planctomycetota bacterium]
MPQASPSDAAGANAPPFAVDPVRCMRLDELRQAKAIGDMAEEVRPLKTGVLLHTRGVPWMCKAVACDLDEPLTKDDLREIVAFYRERGTPPCLELTAYSHEDTLARAAEAGLVLAEVEHVMACPLENWSPPGRLASGLGGISIEIADKADAAAMRALAIVMLSGFPAPGSEPGAMPSEAMITSATDSFTHPRSTPLAATLDGGLVGASGMEVVTLDPSTAATPGQRPAGVVALWGTTVLEDARRRGVQQALIAERLRIGRERGCEVAIIESKPGIPTERNAARLGFQLSYVRLVLRDRSPE